MTITKRVRVTVERLFEITLPDNYDTPEHLKQFASDVHEVDSVDDIFLYAAEHACAPMLDGYEVDGLGLIGKIGHSYGRLTPAVAYHEIYEDTKSEIIP